MCGVKNGLTGSFSFIVFCTTDGQKLMLLAGYVVYYTTNAKLQHTDWVLEVVHGDRLSAVIRDLRPDTTYYFKVAARNKAGYGPLSPTVIFHTAHG